MQKRNFLKEHRSSILIAVVFAIMALVLFLQQIYGTESAGMVRRNAEGESTETQTFYYETEQGEEEQITVDVHPVERTQEEVVKLLEQAVKEWEEEFLGKNTSEDEIRDALVLKSQFCDGLVQAVYESSDYSMIQDDGTVVNDEAEKNGTVVTLQAEFSYSDITRTEVRALRVLPPKKGSRQWLQREISGKAEKTEQESRTKMTFQLPEKVGTQQIIWKKETSSDWCLMLLLGGVAVFCLEWQKKERIRRMAQKRKASLEREYPQMVEQLSLLMGAGLTLRRTWERILQMDQRMQNQEGYAERIYVQEMYQTFLDIRKGMGEKEAYEKFAQRIDLPCYRRLVSILNRNQEKGIRDVCAMLSAESKEAWEVRKNQARKAGEEAGVKLLFPMMLLFVLILIILLFPAVQSFSF